MQQTVSTSDRLIADFDVGSRYNFLNGGLQAYSWEPGAESEASMCSFESGCCLQFDAEENEYIFRSVLLGVTYLFRVHPDEILNAERIA